MHRSDFLRCLSSNSYSKACLCHGNSHFSRVVLNHRRVIETEKREREKRELKFSISSGVFDEQSRFISFIKRPPNEIASRVASPPHVSPSNRRRNYGSEPPLCSPSLSSISKFTGYFRLDIPSGARHGGRPCFSAVYAKSLLTRLSRLDPKVMAFDAEQRSPVRYNVRDLHTYREVPMISQCVCDISLVAL